MRISGKLNYIFCAVIILLSAGNAFCSKAMLPEGLIMEDTFKPGYGSPVGKVRLVQGNVIIMHADILIGYQAKKDLPLYQGDTIVTRKKGRIRFGLNDGTVLTLASETKLIINQSVYNPKKKSRFSFLSMSLGKARFWVRKLVNYKRSSFKIKTPTAVVGVRGSDFIIKATAVLTEVTAFEDTQLSIISPIAPEMEPALLEDFERIIIEEGALPSEVEKVSPEEIEQLKKDFPLDGDEYTPEGKDFLEEAKGQKPEEKPEPVLVPDDELVEPEDGEEPDELAEARAPDMFEAGQAADQEEEIIDQTTDIHEEILEESIGEEEPAELPPFPGHP